ncbi:hypothetical protein V8F33_012322 [Rhypophila sp. PSN 637]
MRRSESESGGGGDANGTRSRRICDEYSNTSIDDSMHCSMAVTSRLWDLDLVTPEILPVLLTTQDHNLLRLLLHVHVRTTLWRRMMNYLPDLWIAPPSAPAPPAPPRQPPVYQYQPPLGNGMFSWYAGENVSRAAGAGAANQTWWRYNDSTRSQRIPPPAPPAAPAPPAPQQPPEDDGDVVLQGNYHTPDDPQVWRETCEFFRHPVDRMEAVYLFLSRTYGGIGQQHERAGGINALGTGLGKTVVSLAVVAVIRLIELHALTVDIPAFGNHQECPHNHSFRITCPCVRGSLSEKIFVYAVDQLGGAPTVMFAHSPTVRQIHREAQDYLEQYIDVRGALWSASETSRFPFVSPHFFKGSHTTVPSDLQSKLIAKRIGPVYPVLFADPARAVEHSGLSPNPSSETGNGGTWSTMTRNGDPFTIAAAYGTWPTNEEIDRFRKPELGTHDWPFAISPRLVIYDEFHKFRGWDTKVHKIMQSWRQRRHPGFNFLAMSATPISGNLSQSLGAVLKLIMLPEHLPGIERQVAIIEASERNRTKHDYEQAVIRCSALLRTIMVRRTIEGRFHDRDIVRLPPMVVNRWWCKSVQGRQPDFRAMV